jgi:hypothetical protein
MNTFSSGVAWLTIAACIAYPIGAAAQSFVRAKLEPQLDRATFMAEGRAGTVALVIGAKVDSKASAASSDSFRPVQNGECYSILDSRILSNTHRLYFAVNHNVPNPPAKNSFLAIQVIRYTKSIRSDVAVSRNDGDWRSLNLHKRAARPVGEGPFMGSTPEEFAAVHRLTGGAFSQNAIKTFFSGSTDRAIEWHAELPRLGSQGVEGFYSSLDPELAPTWSGTIDDYPPAKPYGRLVRSYLISLEYGTKDSKPVIFYTDRLGSDFVIIRVSSAAGSGFNIHQVFSFALNRQDCLFSPSAGFHISSWFGYDQ